MANVFVREPVRASRWTEEARDGRALGALPSVERGPGWCLLLLHSSPRLARKAAALGPTWSTCPSVSRGDLYHGHGLQVHSIADLEVMPLQTCRGLQAVFASFSARSRVVVRFVGAKVFTSLFFVPKTPSLKLFARNPHSSKLSARFSEGPAGCPLNRPACCSLQIS